MKSEIETLQPEAVWRHFSAICKIPRPSGHLEKITQYILDFGKNLGLETVLDKAGNVLIRKPATPGMEIENLWFCKDTWIWCLRKMRIKFIILRQIR